MTEDKYYRHGTSGKTLNDVYRVVSSIDEKIDKLKDEVSELIDARNGYFSGRDILDDYEPESHY